MYRVFNVSFINDGSDVCDELQKDMTDGVSY